MTTTTTATLYLCALCDGPGPLRKVKPSAWYVCEACYKKHGKSHDRVLLEIITRLKYLISVEAPVVEQLIE
jgi:hypothetical protein